MPTYLYGLTLARNAARVPTGTVRAVRAAPRVVVCDSLAAIVSTVDAPPSRVDRGAVMTHDVVLTTVVRNAVTVLASRFGQTFADDDALCRDLAASPNRERVIATLERLDGYGEMRIVMRDIIEPAASMRASITPQLPPGRAYLESLREKLRPPPRPPVDFHALVGNLILDERVERRGDVISVSHLVRFDDEPNYRAELYTTAALEGASVMGPHALYAFAEPGP